MPTITLLRHGQASFGAADYDDLSDLGRRQASVAGGVLATRGLRDPLLVCGTLRRQADTAALCAQAMGIAEQSRVDARWNEYDHVGLVAAGLPDGGVPTDPRAFQALLDAALLAWIRDDADDGWRGFADGVVGALHDLADTLQGRDAVVATSGGVIAATCGHLLGLPPEGVVALNRITVNAGLTTLIAGRSGVSLLTLNDHAHFTGDAAALRTYR